MFGGQSINAWDYDLAPYVDKSFKKAVKHTASEWLEFNGYKVVPMDFSAMKYGMDIDKARKIILDNLKNNPASVKAKEADADRIYTISSKLVEDETKQAMEAAIHNFNSLHSRAGKLIAGACRDASERIKKHR